MQFLISSSKDFHLPMTTPRSLLRARFSCNHLPFELINPEDNHFQSSITGVQFCCGAAVIWMLVDAVVSSVNLCGFDSICLSTVQCCRRVLRHVTQKYKFVRVNS